MADDPTKTGPAPDEPEDDDVDEPEGDAPEGGEEQEWTPPTREQWQAQQDAHKAALEAEKAKLNRARNQAKRLREGGTAKQEGTPGEGAQPAAAGEVDVWRGRAVRSAAKAALLDRGADSETVGLMLSGLKAERIEFDADDEPELDDWLDDMEERYPKLFAKTPPAAAAPERPRAGRVEQGAPAGGRPVRPKLSLGEAIIAKSEAARLAGRRGIRG